MTPVSSLGSHCGTAPRSVANTTSCPCPRRWCHGTATSVVSKSWSGSGTTTFMSGGVTLRGAGLRLGGLCLAVLRRGVRHQVGEQVLRHVRDLFDRAVEGLLVGRRRLREAADLAGVLERGGAGLFGRRRRLEVVERSDVAAHASSVLSGPGTGRGTARARGRG